MQRRAYAPAAALAAAVLTASLAACSGASGGDGSGEDAKSGNPGSTAPAAEPGKYRGLPEPCGYVSRDTLRRLLPTEDDSDPEAEKLYKGQAAITYDTDRRTGCRWRLETPEGTRHLSVDFERVVSYQPGVSDEQRAKELYERQAAAAHIPASSASGTPSATPSASASGGAHPQGGSAGEKPAASGSPSSAPSGPSSPPADAGRFAPRVLDDLGDDAFVDDKLNTTGSGVHRDISIVFRSANVLVSIAYDQWSPDKRHEPKSEDLQGGAHALARELDAGHFGN
ncbi:hypothetical protein [Streptomyces sp. ISL-11]|uniref:hypothetical protein n=1 Tax=Streptomyces sp. ISL-11 TaxID=2819174 RepID=UPI001BE8258D|nr:hypothetical protein [Streptomyces sp. ISL-11]MBT2384413.1 hypothetical protein [Streptomyces sp. ISL-11]